MPDEDFRRTEEELLKGRGAVSYTHLADRKYAVKNAVPELRQIADEVIGENKNDGVAEFLKKDFKA